MDGKALYEYARTNEPLPRPIQSRDAQVLSLELVDWQESAAVSPSGIGHKYIWPTKEPEEAAKENFQKIKRLIVEAEQTKPDEEKFPEVQKYVVAENKDVPEEELDKSGKVPPAFTLKMVVSSGTYVRSIVYVFQP
jgi:tRNA pseudouridine55 synthase